MPVRPLAVTVSLLLVGAAPVLSQTHAARPPAQPPVSARTHGSGHVRPAAAHHAAVRARLHGTWRGSLRPAHGAATGMHVAIISDSVQGVTLRVNADQSMRAGAATYVAVDGARLRWTQEVAGSACTATAIVVAATSSAPETLEGTMSCESGEMTFSLRRVSS